MTLESLNQSEGQAERDKGHCRGWWLLLLTPIARFFLQGKTLPSLNNTNECKIYEKIKIISISISKSNINRTTENRMFHTPPHCKWNNPQ